MTEVFNQLWSVEQSLPGALRDRPTEDARVLVSIGGAAQHWMVCCRYHHRLCVQWLSRTDQRAVLALPSASPRKGDGAVPDWFPEDCMNRPAPEPK
jgi:hypothetical protein